MIPTNFEYKRVSSVAEAISLLEQHGYDAKILSGGHSLVPAMKLRLNSPAVLIDIRSIPGMDKIEDRDGFIWVGANTTHGTIAASELIAKEVPVLAQAARVIGDVQVRNRGTIGGSLAHSDPSADYPAAVLAAGAVIVAEGPAGAREIDAADFFQGIYMTALDENEIITHVKFPKGNEGVYLKFFQPASRFAVVGIAVVRTNEGVRVGVTGVADTPYRATGVEKAWNGSNASEAAGHVTDGVEVMSDHYASAEYRAHLAQVFTKRALGSLAKDDLTKIEGIGPKIAEILAGHGVKSFEALANTSPATIKAWLQGAGGRFAAHNPGTWPDQARLAADGKWDELKAWQDELDGGV